MDSCLWPGIDCCEYVLRIRSIVFKSATERYQKEVVSFINCRGVLLTKRKFDPFNLKLESMRKKMVVLASGVVLAIIGFAFLVPVVHTTMPPPTHHTQCDVPCAPYIAESVYGSTTYYYLGYGGEFAGHWGDFTYYRLYFN